jgi:hypothetical protein
MQREQVRTIALSSELSALSHATIVSGYGHHRCPTWVSCATSLAQRPSSRTNLLDHQAKSLP